MADLLKEVIRNKERWAKIKLASPVIHASSAQTAKLEASWREWLTALMAKHVTLKWAGYHEDFWQWAWGLQTLDRPRPFVAIWPRGGAKSSSAEMAVVAWGARRVRSYVLYVCATQPRADDHVSNIGRMMEGAELARHYPALSVRAVGKYGSSLGWRRNRLRAQQGITVDALGLDVAARGLKIEEHRPDAIILDDVDESHDSDVTIEEKVKTITRTVLPAGADTCAILAVQNMVHPRGVFARLANRATAKDGSRLASIDWLVDRIVSGPHPAVLGLAYEQCKDTPAVGRPDSPLTTQPSFRWVITAGEPTWPDGMGIEKCQAFMERDGPTAFLAERQHEVADPAGGTFSHLTWQRCEHMDLPRMIRVVCWCDPAVSDTDKSDANGIAVWGLGADGKLYALWSWEQRGTPLATVQRALAKAMEYGAASLGIETDQGGETWISVWRDAVKDLRIEHAPYLRTDKAGSGHGSKAERAGRVLVEYERAHIVHVIGTHDTLERALHRWPQKPLDLVDAVYWAVNDLRSGMRAPDIGATASRIAGGFRGTGSSSTRHGTLVTPRPGGHWGD